jgi:hypothetical protein
MSASIHCLRVEIGGQLDSVQAVSLRNRRENTDLGKGKSATVLNKVPSMKAYTVVN